MFANINAALLFLINILFGLYLFVLAARIILVYTGANYYNPLVRFVVHLTQFIVKPMQTFAPTYRHIEFSSLLLIFILQCIKFILLILLTGNLLTIDGLILLVIGDTIKLILLTFFYAIIIEVILTWVQPHSPVTYVLSQFTAPIMRPIQRVVPPIGGIDISPIPALILLQLLIILLVNPIMAAGFSAIH